MTALQAELGSNTPSGAGIGLSQVEAPIGTNYSANSSDPEFSGKTITLKSGPSMTSGHANVVAYAMYGQSLGAASGVTQIDAYEVNTWLQTGFLRFGNSSAAPAIESRRIQNHSWIGSYSNLTYDTEVVRRLDYAIQRDGFVACVGLNNMNTNPVPALLAHSYNAISIGVPSGQHSSGGTSFDTAGRIKPELIVPSDYYATSYSCGVASGAAALLLQTADASPALINARTNSEVIKALLLAGATKGQFPTWTRTPTQPLDLVYGAGQLNIQNSYHLLKAGEFAASSSVTVSNRGWDFATSTASAARYFFDVPASYLLTNFSVVLTWNRTVTDSNPGPTFAMTVTVADMNLRLYRATNFTVGALLDSSVSTIQNVEHIYTNLSPGRYALEVTSDITGADYALAWGGGLKAQVTTNYPTPYWWLASYGYTNNQETVVTNFGANSFPLWQSYIAGLVPTNPASQLRFTSQSLLQKTNLVLTWNTVTGRVYSIVTSPTATTTFAPLPGAVNLPATVQAFTNVITPTSAGNFYRLQVQLP